MHGGEESFDEAFDDLYPRARTLAYRILGDLPSAEDAAAEAMTRALVRWNRVERLPHRDGWVLRVTANVALDMARRRTRGAAAVLAATDPAAVGTDAQELVVLRAALVQALVALPKRQREAIVLVHLLGYSPSDAAATMNVSVSSVGQHVRRGLDRMRVDALVFPDPVEPGAV